MRLLSSSGRSAGRSCPSFIAVCAGRAVPGGRASRTTEPVDGIEPSDVRARRLTGLQSNAARNAPPAIHAEGWSPTSRRGRRSRVNRPRCCRLLFGQGRGRGRRSLRASAFDRDPLESEREGCIGTFDTRGGRPRGSEHRLCAVLLARPSVVQVRLGRAFAFATLFLVPLFALRLGVTDHVERSKTTEFCLSCHSMEPYGKSLLVDDRALIRAVHYQNHLVPADKACFTCHTDYTMYGDVNAKLRGLRQRVT
jgi:hypothetical protein